MIPTVPRLVLVEWEDSHTEGGWQRLDGDLADRALVCRSVGWLALDGEAVKIVVPHINSEEDGVPLQGSGVMTIPARAVLRMTNLATNLATSADSDPREEGVK